MTPFVRIAFDPSRPAFLSRGIEAQGQSFAADTELPWKSLGMSESDLRDFWRASLVYFKFDAVPTDSPAPPLPAPSPELVATQAVEQREIAAPSRSVSKRRS